MSDTDLRQTYYLGSEKDKTGPIYGGAVNYWNKGVDATKVADQVLTPLQHVPGYEQASLHVVGEAYSWSKEEGAQQGWVEGALQTAEAAVEQMGKKAPEWMPADQALP